MGKKDKTIGTNSPSFFPPVVAVLGHVDHGKTTLLDAIRKTSVAQKEHGGITQRIGASSIEVVHDNQKRKITFIDTPGHEAFSAVRSRGAKVADIGLLIVSSVDGVMPQTRESIKLLLEAKIPFIVVLTKSDLAEKNPEKVKGQLSKEKIMFEEMGGDVPVIEVSAKENKGIKELLELILLVFDMHKSSLKKEIGSQEPFEAIVIESKLDQKSGPKATIVVKNGKVLVRDELVCEGIEARVKALINDQGQSQQSATIGEAVEVLGFEKVPSVGGIVSKKGEKIMAVPVTKTQAMVLPLGEIEYSLEEGTLPLIVCADTLGSLEAIVSMLPQGVFVVSQKTGEITPSDVLLAKSTRSIIVGFNIKVSPLVLKLAKTEKVVLKNYSLIYELLDEIRDVITGKREALLEEILGKAKILASFPFEKTKVLGIVVLEGRIARGDKVRLLRGDEEIGKSNIVSLRQGKNPISKVEEGGEAGVILMPFLDFTIGDMLICHR